MARTVRLGDCPQWLLALVCVVVALACCLCHRSGGACPPAGHGHGAAGPSGGFCCVYGGGGPGGDCFWCNGDDRDRDCCCGECFVACLGALIDYFIDDDEV